MPFLPPAGGGGGGGGGSGTVTAVGLSAPSGLFTVGGSPVTSSGTLSLSTVAQAANKVWCGPASGGNAAPTFRLLSVADVPDLSGTYLKPNGNGSALTGITFSQVGSTPTTLSGYGITDAATSAGVAPAFATLTDGATVTLTCDSAKVSQNATLTLGGNRTLAISGATSGTTGVLIVKQDATGSRTITLPSGSKVIGGGSGAVTLSTAANSVDVLTWIYDGTNYLWTFGKNFS